MKFSIVKIFLACFILSGIFCRKQNFENGDIIFQTSQSSQSKAIQTATNSRYSHVGLIYNKNNKLYVLEAVEPVKLTPLEAWINRGEGRKFVLKRLINYRNILKPDVLKKMKSIAQKYIGKHYDFYFEWSDDKLYCSELVWKVYYLSTGIELSPLRKLKTFNLTDQAVKKKLLERFGQNLPLNENVISPQDIFESKDLYTVIAN